MKKIKEWYKTKQVQYILFAMAGLFLGWLFFSPSSTTPQVNDEHHSHDSIAEHTHSHDLQQDENGVWTCSMHPQIKQDKPGKCPICGMDLIPLRKSGNGHENADPSAIQLSEEAIALANVQTSRVSKENPVKEVRLYGKIAPDERSLQSQTAHVGGRIESLAVDFTGETVRAGQTLATLYSPDLFTAQQELLEAIKNWDKLREAEAFTDEQKVRLRDPQTEWHLEKTDEQNYNLYPLYISKHFRCNLSEMQPGQPGGADWSWSSPYKSTYAIRLKVDGDGTIKDPSFTTPQGVIKFPCETSDRQYLLYTFDGKAVVTDKNYNVISEVQPQGNAVLPAGSSAVAFSCEQTSEDAPEVIIRYITKGTPEVIKLKK